MPAYVVAIRDKTKDPAELKAYSATAGKARAEGMKLLAAYGANEALEGPPTEGVVLIEFPDMASAKAWYDSPAYTEARKHRFLGADYRFILFEGLKSA